MGVTSFQQSLYEFFDSGLLFRIALLQKTILFLLWNCARMRTTVSPLMLENMYGRFLPIQH